MSHSFNKVYVNPNFNKPLTASVSNTQNNKIHMHINPKFTQNILQNQKRIYVNPNFVNPIINNSDNVVGSSTHKIYKNKGINGTKATLNYPDVNIIKEMKPQTISNSRYSLVRHIGSMKSDIQASNKVATIKISKYKTVAINSLQKKINTSNILQESQKSNLNNKQLLYTNNTNTNTLKYVRNVTPKIVAKVTGKHKYKLSKRESHSILTSTNKSMNTSVTAIKKNPTTKFHLDRKYMKKNNVPCPLYKKYGKCLRSIIGTCDFLHDKKHVSVCRKFIKGVCHDKDCLLSHELSSKKMPTCYFYLKGMCTKIDCPYLHVKLNEKAKLCPEFVQGYCEKGDLCLNRHINVDPKTLRSKAVNRLTKNIRKFHKPNTNSMDKLKNINNKKSEKVSRIRDNIAADVEQLAASVDCRYYQDLLDIECSQTNESIKPSRCKLGDLPSYIKL